MRQSVVIFQNQMGSLSTTAWEALVYTLSGKPGQKQSPGYQHRMLPTILHIIIIIIIIHSPIQSQNLHRHLYCCPRVMVVFKHVLVPNEDNIDMPQFHVGCF